MSNEIEAIVQSLRSLERTEDVNQAYGAVDRMNRESKTADLLELAAALEKGCDVSGEAKFPFEAVCDHVEEVLALTPSDDHVDALFTLLSRPRVRSVNRPRSIEMRTRAFASRLGHGQSKDALVNTLERLGNDKEHLELLACWMHECILRGTSLERDEVVAKFHARLADARHPLGEMPLVLLEAESEAPTYMPMYGSNAISKAVARLESGAASTRTIPPPGEHEAPRVTRVEDAAALARMREAIAPWNSGPNSKSEARIFELDPAVVSASPGRWLLRALSLECLEGAKALHAERVSSEVVWGALFAAAANGGAYSSGLGAGYGRRAAWTSLGALVGAPADATPRQIDARAPSASFLVFGAASGWWNDIAWDIGALAVRADGASVAVLAATDAD